jgi:hypothetical protein
VSSKLLQARADLWDRANVLVGCEPRTERSCSATRAGGGETAAVAGVEIATATTSKQTLAKRSQTRTLASIQKHAIGSPVVSAAVAIVSLVVLLSYECRARRQEHACAAALVVAGFAWPLGVVEVALVDEAEAGEGEELVDLADVF